MLEGCGCEVRSDRLTRQLYATDASLYRIEPAAVAFPTSAAEVAAATRAAAEAGLPITPRGAGTGLTGGALGDGLVLETARHTGRIFGLDREAGTVHVGAGVVLDALNAHLAPAGLWFGPDVATSSRATLGGMIGNDSSGARAPVYGTTSDHVVAVEAVFADGTVAWLGGERDQRPELRAAAAALVARHADEIERRLPPGLVKRWPGYGLDRARREPGSLPRLVAGSEGTLVTVASAVLRVVPRPRRRDLAVICFAAVDEALAATVELLDLAPAAIEHVDRLLFDQTRGQPAFRRARDLLRLDDEPCEAMLLVELFDDHDGARRAAIAARGLGLRQVACATAEERELVWAIRRAGLSLLTGRPGRAKTATGIEDVCVRPEQLPEYVGELRRILTARGLEASYYGHAASGLLHVRPVIDLTAADGAEVLRGVADEVSALCRRLRGSFAAEHGVGMARTAYLAEHLGPELVAASAEVKRLFDPAGILNPGKIVDTGRYRIDRDLRREDGGPLELPVAPAWGYVDKDRSLAANLLQCNGNGACRKATPTMCPTFVATGEEVMTTRGRANVLRSALEGRLGERAAAVASAEVEAALGGCLACKACKTECPTGVDMALLKADLLWARHRLHGVPLADRLIAAADLLGRIGCVAAPLANRLLASPLVRRLLERVTGLNAERSLPPFARRRFDRWFDRRERSSAAATRGQVVLWDDTWTRYHEPGIGQAAVTVLETAGFEVLRPVGRRCCGRPAASRGLLDRVRAAAGHNLALLAPLAPAAPIVFLEPSCWSMFRDEYRQLGLADADRVAARCVTFEQLLGELLAAEPTALPLAPGGPPVAIHAHCHQAALDAAGAALELARRVTGGGAERLGSGCCGMAGAFGMMRATDGLSRAVAAPLLELVAALPAGTELVAAGTSCRHQLAELAGRRPLHPAELVATRLADRDGS